MRGFRTTYNVYVAKNSDWRILGGAFTPVDFPSESAAMDVADEAMKYEGVQAAMVVLTEEALQCDLKTRKEQKITTYIALVRQGNPP